METLKNESPSYSTVKKLAAEFKSGRENINSCLTKDAATAENVMVVHTLIMCDRRRDKQSIASKIGIRLWAIQSILTDILGRLPQSNDVIYTCDDVAFRFCLPTRKLKDPGTKTKISRKAPSQ